MDLLIGVLLFAAVAGGSKSTPTTTATTTRAAAPTQRTTADRIADIVERALDAGKEIYEDQRAERVQSA